MMETETFLTPDEYAARRRTTRGTLEVERARGRGPAYVRIGRKVLYPLSAVADYERAGLVIPGEPAGRRVLR